MYNFTFICGSYRCRTRPYNINIIIIIQIEKIRNCFDERRRIFYFWCHMIKSHVSRLTNTSHVFLRLYKRKPTSAISVFSSSIRLLFIDLLIIIRKDRNIHTFKITTILFTVKRKKVLSKYNCIKSLKADWVGREGVGYEGVGREL